MKKKFLYTVLVFSFAYFGAMAQTQSVKVIDLIVSPVLKADTAQTDSTILLVQFKINNAAQAANANIKFGSVQGSGNVLDLNATVINDGVQSSISFNGHSLPIVNKEAKVLIQVSNTQFDASLFVTLLVSQTDGVISSPQYFKLQ